MAFLDPLLSLSPLMLIFVVSFVIAAVSTAAYKYLTDQVLMKDLREKQKLFQKEFKNHRDNPKKLAQLQKSAMEANTRYMMQSLKPMLITFLPIILVFGWANTHLAFEPLSPGQEFKAGLDFVQVGGTVRVDAPEGLSVEPVEQEISAQTRFSFSGPLGEYLVKYHVDDEVYNQIILISSDQRYAVPIKKINDGRVHSLVIEMNKLKPLNLFGWKIGWLGTYIIFVMVLSILMRKVFKVH